MPCFGLSLVTPPRSSELPYVYTVEPALVGAPVPEQWAAWPTYPVEPFVKMKFDVHWAPWVNVWTPGWMAAVAAGAHADAAGASTSVASTEAPATHSLTLFICLTLPRVCSMDLSGTPLPASRELPFDPSGPPPWGRELSRRTGCHRSVVIRPVRS